MGDNQPVSVPALEAGGESSYGVEVEGDAKEKGRKELSRNMIAKRYL